MVSMALTFTTQGTLGDFASQTDTNACTQTMDNQLAASYQGDSFDVPGTCLSGDGNPITPELQGTDAGSDGAQICVESNNAAYGDSETWGVIGSDDSCDP